MMGDVHINLRVYEEDCKEWDDMAAKLGLDRSAFVRFMVKKGIEHEREGIEVRAGMRNWKEVARRIFLETQRNNAKKASPKRTKRRS